MYFHERLATPRETGGWIICWFFKILLPIHFQICLSRERIKANIARGTTDPEIDSMTWTKFGNNMAPLALVANLATRWRHLH